VERLDSPPAIYQAVLDEARRRGIEFAVGGGMAVAAYTVHRQSTKDIDLYVRPQDREAMIVLVHEYGLKDYFEVCPYDRKWIYRSYIGNVIIDIMWAMPNQKAQVDIEWIRRGPEVELYGERVRVLAAEELIWAKLYVLQRDRCDWPDILNLLYCTADQLDWDHLVKRVDDDAPLLGAVLTVFRWLCPERAAAMPRPIWRRLAEHVRRSGAERANLLDTRPWFIPALEHAPVGR
jgi:hypothetical protein